MKIVGLTGGIGSGKTTVAKMFQNLGVPLYIADDRAKLLMNSSGPLKQKLVALFGAEAYQDGQLNRAFLASKIFQDETLLQKMNAIVHPEVGIDFEKWKQQQNAVYGIKEAAIIFENNLASQYDYIITVIADLDQRIARVIKRDDTTEAKIMTIVNNQLSDAEKVNQSDFVIINHDMDDTYRQVLHIHQQLSKLIEKN